MDIRCVTLDDLCSHPSFSDMLREYEQECALGGLPANFCETSYRELESNGLINILAAYNGDQLLGFLSLMITILPKYTLPIASSESFFVSPKHRKTGAGLRLLKTAEYLATERGAVGMLMSAPTGSRLESVAVGVGYAPSNTVFFKELQ
jgi:GNAT superfamily N-acetyltransferase